MQNFALFVGNVSVHLVALMSGIVSFIIATVEAVRGKPVIARWFGVAGLFCVFAACDQAWQDEHRNAQSVISDKANLAAAYDECHTSAALKAAYTLGLEKNSLSSRETIDRQQRMSDKQANDLSSCLLIVDKMNPAVKEKTLVIVANLDVAGHRSNGFLFIITTTERRNGLHGYLKCQKPFRPLDVPSIPTSGTTAMGSGPPIPISDREYELKISLPGLEWGPNTPALMIGASNDGFTGNCDFTSI